MKVSEIGDDYITLSQVIRITKVSATYVTVLAKSNKLRYIATPLGRLFSREDAEALAAAREAKRGSH